MTALAERLGRAFGEEPPLGDAVDAVLRRAEHLRRRRIRRLLLAGLFAVVAVVALGYGLTTVLLPATAHRAAPGPARDDVRAVLVELTGRAVVLSAPVAGPGWRRFTAEDAAGRPRGTIDIAVYAAPRGLCLPVLADPGACALPERRGAVEFARYSADRDLGWQLNEAIARRLPDGRTVAVLATGARNTGDAPAGRPPLTALQTGKAATDPRVMAAFAATENCGVPDPGCPALRIAVRPVG